MEVAPSEIPVIVKSLPNELSQENECFSVVDETILKYGGKRIIGWSIWENAGAFIEAEFHAVWQRHDGELQDLNKRPRIYNSILFLPDTKKEYSGVQVDNIRKPLTKDNDVIRLLYLAKRRFEIMNRGERASQYGEISLTGKELKEMTSLHKEMFRLEIRINNKYGKKSNESL